MWKEERKGKNESNKSNAQRGTEKEGERMKETEKEKIEIYRINKETREKKKNEGEYEIWGSRWKRKG